VNPLELLKVVGGPGSIGLLIVSFVAGLWLIYRRPRWRRLAQVLLASVSVLYVVLSLPVVSDSIAAGLPRFTGTRPAPGTVDTLIVFDGDNRRGRLSEGLRVWNEASPRQMIVSAVSPWLVDGFLEAGVPPERFRQDSSADNTRAQVDWTSRYAAGHPDERIAVVASALQMPRVEALALARGLHVGLVPSPIDAEPNRQGWRIWRPSYLALRISRDALYELVALEYYALRGWT
jgi:uncharacterized SAM-binding protein YcdF (DUF218 family)